MAKKVWKINEGIHSEATQLAAEVGISPLLGQLLWNRGITVSDQARAFLTPDLGRLHDPYLFPDMRRAVERIQRAIANGERVLVYGDYDVDGVTSIALMVRTLAKYLPGRLLYYIPRRLEEGYGLHLSSLEKAIAKEIDLIITVDCGISAVEEAAFLKSKQVDLIITDHHEPQANLPDAYAIVNPKLPGCGYPFTQLAGVGVAFKLLQGLAKVIPDLEEMILNNLDLVAFGTVADIVPLLDENRIVVKYGLDRLQKTDNVGIQALLQSAGLKDRVINCGHIGYILAPRINAAGRMGNPSIGVKLFLAGDPIQALDLAKELERENLSRQETENLVLQDACAQIAAVPGQVDEYALVLAGDGWHPGVIGIVASRLVDLYHKPVILISFEGDEGRGSGRSIAGFNLFEALDSCQQLLIRFGGHEFAAGLSIRREDIPAFRTMFQELAKQKLTTNDLQPFLRIESLIELNRVNLELTREMSKLAPCGTANPTPVFGCKAVNLVDYRGVGENGKHLKMRVSVENTIREGIGFNMGAVVAELASSKEVDLAFSLEENQWNGSTQVQLNLKDIVARGNKSSE